MVRDLAVITRSIKYCVLNFCLDMAIVSSLVKDNNVQQGFDVQVVKPRVATLASTPRIKRGASEFRAIFMISLEVNNRKI